MKLGNLSKACTLGDSNKVAVGWLIHSHFCTLIIKFYTVLCR